MDLPIEVPLNRPLTIDGKEVKILCLDEPDVDAQIAIAELEEKLQIFDEPNDIQAGIVTRFWISRLADIPEKAAGKLKASDVDAVTAALGKILGLEDPNAAGASSGKSIPAK